MFKKFLVAAVLVVYLRNTTALVTMSPKLAQIIPKGLPDLGEVNTICFNNYWAKKEALELRIRERWNCTNGCSTLPECCISYKVWDSLSGLDLVEDCSRLAQNMIGMFLPMALDQIKDRCEPFYGYGSPLCKAMEANLPPLPKESKPGNFSIIFM